MGAAPSVPDVRSAPKPDVKDAPRPVEAPKSPDVLPAVSSQPDSPRALRELLHLPEHKVAERTYEEKLARVHGLAKAIRERMGLKLFRDKDEYEKGRFDSVIADQQGQKLGFREGLRRRKEVWDIQRVGIKDAEGTMEFIEKTLPIYGYHQVHGKWVALAVKELGGGDEQEGMRRIAAGVERYKELHMYTNLNNFEAPAFRESIGTLADIDEAQFQKVASELNQFSYIQLDKIMTQKDQVNSDATLLLEIFKNGGLTQEQRSLLEKEQLYMDLTGNVIYERDGKADTAVHVSLWSALNDVSVSRLEEFLPHVVEFADTKVDAQKDDAIGPVISGNFLGGLEYIRSQGGLAVANALSEKGWSLRGVYNNINVSLTARDEVLVQIQEASRFAGKEEDVVMAGALMENFFGVPHLDVTGVLFYEQMIAKKDTLVDIATISHRLPKLVGESEYTMVKLEDGQVKINYDSLKSKVRQVVISPRVPDEEKRFANAAEFLLQGGSVETELPLVAYLARAGELSELFDRQNNPKANFVEGVLNSGIDLSEEKRSLLIAHCSDIENFSLPFIWKNMDLIQDRVRATQAIKKASDEFIATLSPDDQTFVRYLQSQPDAHTQLFFIQNKDRFAEFVVNGLPTQVCLETIASQGMYRLADVLLTEEALAGLPEEKQEYWKAFISIPLRTRNVLVDMKNRFPEFFVDGKPTATFLNTLAVNSANFQDIERIVSGIDVRTFPPGEREFWTYFKVSNGLLGNYALQHRERFSELIVDGRPTAGMLREVALLGRYELTYAALGQADIASFSPSEKAFWEFYRGCPAYMQTFLLKRQESFPELVVDGNPTPVLYRGLATENSVGFLLSADRNAWKQTFGDETINGFLNALPTRTDEKRNAFTHNEYDRTTEFITFLVNNASKDFSLTTENIDMLTRYVGQFGLAKNPALFHYYKNLSLFEQGKLPALPEGIAASGISSTKELGSKLSEIRARVYSETQMVDLSGLSEFEVGMLKLITGKSTHRFDGGRQTMETIVEDFQRDMAAGEIVPLPEGYHTEELAVSNVTIEFNADAVREDYQTLADEIIATIENPNNVEGIKGDLQAMMQGKIAEQEKVQEEILPAAKQEVERTEKDLLREIDALALPETSGDEVLDTIITDLKKAVQEKRESTPLRFIEDQRRQVEAYIKKNPEMQEQGSILLEKTLVWKSAVQEYEKAKRREEAIPRELAASREGMKRLEDVKDMDTLLVTLLEMNFSDTNQQKVVNGIFRRIVFSKIFQKNHSPGFLQDTRAQLEAGISASSIEAVLNIVDEMGKTHVLNLQNNNQEGYFTEEAFQKIKANKRGRDLPRAFSPYAGKLREEVEKFQMIMTGTDSQVRAIPDRGFVGEMSGYLADVCYTAEYPLLKKWPNVVPYKFVTSNAETGEAEFIGSVIVFEVDDAEGNPSMLVRAFDVPDESKVDIDKFIEDFLDKMVEVGKARGKRRVLIPGVQGAISNYHMSINHMDRMYKQGKEPVSLAEPFAFNGYDLTSNCFVAREIPQEEAPIAA